MEGQVKSAAYVRDMNKNHMDIGVAPKQEVLVGDQLPSPDEELIIHYLDKKMIDQQFPNHTIHEVDFFLYHPQQLTQMHHPSQANEWYFLSPASKNYTVEGQSNSENNDGHWEPCGTDSLVHKDGKLIGYRKTLNYIQGKHEENERKKTEWQMHEYRLDRSRDVRTGTTSEDMQWILCKLYKLKSTFVAAEEKEPTKVAGPNDGVASTDQTIRGSDKANNTINDKGPSTGLTRDLLSLPDTDEVTAPPQSSLALLDQACKIWSFDKPLTCSQPQDDQGTILPTPLPQHGQTTTPTPSTGRRKPIKKVANDKRPSYRCKRGSQPLPDSDQGSMMPRSVNANSGPQHDQGTMMPPPLPQNDQRPRLPTSIGPHETNFGVVTDKGQSNSLNCDSHPPAASSQGLVMPRGFEKILDRPTGICSFDGTRANSCCQLGTVLPSRPQHGQPTILPYPQHDQQTMLPLIGIHNAKNDEVNRPTLDHHLDAQNLPPSMQVPKLPLVINSAQGSHENEAALAEAPRYGGWPFYTPESKLPLYRGPFQSLTEEELAYFDRPDPEYPQAYENNKEDKK